MNKLWCFGDSFIDADSAVNYHSDLWTRQLANKLNFELMSFGLGGTSLSYTYSEFNKVRQNIANDDCVIVCLTNISRRWHRKQYPTNGLCMPINDEDLNTIKHYRLYLDSDHCELTYLDNFLYNIAYLNAKTIILCAFQDTCAYLTETNKHQKLCIVKYPLIEISQREFDNNIYTRWKQVKPWPGESRPNHLTRSNHNILADKLAAYCKYGTAIDLKTGFKEAIITAEMEADSELCRREFLDRNWQFWTAA